MQNNTNYSRIQKILTELVEHNLWIEFNLLNSKVYEKFDVAKYPIKYEIMINDFILMLSMGYIEMMKPLKDNYIEYEISEIGLNFLGYKRLN